MLLLNVDSLYVLLSNIVFGCGIISLELIYSIGINILVFLGIAPILIVALGIEDDESTIDLDLTGLAFSD